MSPTYPPDKGGVFASDVHRRVAGHLPGPGDDCVSAEDLLARIDPDEYTPVTSIEDLVSVLEELKAEGQATYLKSQDGWRLAKAGLEALSGPIAHEPAALEGLQLEAREEQDAELAAADEESARAAAAERVELAEEELRVAKAELKERS